MLLPLRCAFLLFVMRETHGIHIQGLETKYYRTGERVPVELGKLMSFSGSMPYEYRQLPLCKPKDGWIPSGANLGELVTGDKLWNAPIELRMKTNVTCRIVCVVDDLEQGSRKERLLRDLIVRNYRATIYVDRVPVRELIETSPRNGLLHQENVTMDVGGLGVPLGHHVVSWDSESIFVQTHYKFVILYEEHDSSAWDCEESVFPPCNEVNKRHSDRYARVVAAYVTTYSLTRRCFRESLPQLLGSNITYTYEVRWIQNNSSMHSQWETLLRPFKADYLQSWFAIYHSLTLSLCIAFVTALLVLRALKVDIMRLQDEDLPMVERGLLADFDIQSGKFLSSDVFRPPSYCLTLCVAVGSGIQFLLLVSTILLVASMGIFYSFRRGALVNTSLRLFPVFGYAAGYFSAKLNKDVGALGRVKLSLATATFFPMTLFVCYIVLDLLYWQAHSSGAIPFTAMLTIFVSCVLLNIPSTLAGAYFVYRTPTEQESIKVQESRSPVPSVPWYNSYIFVCPLLGAVPFAISYLQIFYVLRRSYSGQYAHINGFLLVDFWILVLSCIEVSIIAVYWTLKCRDYDWWWRSFLCPATSSLYMFIVFLAYYYSISDLHGTAFLLLAGQLFMASLIFALIGGSVGLQASHYFLKAVYSSFKFE